MKKRVPDDSGLYGYLAEFETPEALVEAARRTRAAGYWQIDAFSPYPVEGLSDAIGFRRSWIPFLMLGGGMAGLAGGLGLQYWASVINYPLNIGGRPLVSLPMWIPVTFETTILVAALTGVLAMFVLNGLPRPYHPVFNVERFARASQDGFFLVIEAGAPPFDREGTRQFLGIVGAKAIYEVTP